MFFVTYNTNYTDISLLFKVEDVIIDVNEEDSIIFFPFYNLNIIQRVACTPTKFPTTL